MLTKIKAKLQKVLASQVKAVNEIGLTPNMISAVGIVLALLSAFLYIGGRENLVWAVIMLLLSGYCDMLDGALARFCHSETPFGGFLDSMLDRYTDSAVYAGIILGGLCSVPWGLAALIGSLLVSYARAKGEAANVKMMSVGIAERAERILIISAASLVEIFLTKAIEVAMVILAFLTNLTVLQRSIHAYRALKKEEKT